MSTPAPNPPPLLLLDEADTVVTAPAPFTKGDLVRIDETTVSLCEDVAVGFKVARRDLEPGDRIIKWGAPIGSAVRPIARGDLVHTHNMKSDYLPTYERDEKGFTKRDLK